AVRGAQLILIPSPASAQADIARAIAPHLENGQVVFLPPGTFGSYVMDRIARQAGSSAQVTYAETGTLPYLARQRASGEVAFTIAPEPTRIAVREEHGYRAPHFPLSDNHTSDRWRYGDAHSKLVDSGDWREHIDLHRHRYMTEDVVLGLAFLASVARWASCEAPVARGLLALAGAILGRDLGDGPR